MTQGKINRKILILGSTGSVGTQAADVAAEHGITVDGICASHNIAVLEEQVRRFRPRFCAVIDPDAARDLRTRIADTDTKVLVGGQGVLEMIAESDADCAVNSIMGRAGLEPTLAVIDRGMDLALANKETLVTAGQIVMARARAKGVAVLPVDSEHCAIFQCLRSGKPDEVSKLILTASGGPFYGRKREELRAITPAQALAHPTWSMGAKITIDSATMMNKGFEVIEACHLFAVSPDDVEVVIHRQSVIHSMVEFADRSVIAQMAVPDMRMCVRYALAYPERAASPGQRLSLTDIGTLTFSSPDDENFPLLPLARSAYAQGGIIPCVLNGANEAAVALFLAGKISFTDISDLVAEATRSIPNIAEPTIDDIARSDAQARDYVNGVVHA